MYYIALIHPNLGGYVWRSHTYIEVIDDFASKTRRYKISNPASFTLVQLTYICVIDKQRTIIFYKDYFEEFFEKQLE